MTDFTSIDYLLIGHVAADNIEGRRVLGGTVSYAAHTAQAFGLKVGVVTSATPDDPLLSELLRYAQVKCLPAARTTTYDNVYTPDGRVQFVRAVANRIGLENIPPIWRAAPLVHIAPLADELAFSLPHSLRRLGSEEQRILLTPQGWLRQWGADGRVRFRDWCDKTALQSVDYVVISDEDIAVAPHLEATFATLTRTLIVTRNQAGGCYYLNGAKHQYTALPVTSVDPTGAGDVFAASLLAASCYNIATALQIAATLAAYSVTRRGLASAPTPQEVALTQRKLTRNHDQQNIV